MEAVPRDIEHSMDKPLTSSKDLVCMSTNNMVDDNISEVVGDEQQRRVASFDQHDDPLSEYYENVTQDQVVYARASGSWKKQIALPLIVLCLTIAVTVFVVDIPSATSRSTASKYTQRNTADRAEETEATWNTPTQDMLQSSDSALNKFRTTIVMETFAQQQAMMANSAVEGFTKDACASERYSVKGDDDIISDSHRKLQGPAMFTELTCNANMPVCNKTTTFSQLVAKTLVGTPVIIPCGVCVTVDQQANQLLNLTAGLRIEGKLYFPSTASVTIRTTFVLVLGILKMDTPASGKIVKISLYGENDIYFTPTEQNVNSCSSSGCKIGKKVIAVAGGRLDINGYSATCPTWEKLRNIERSGLRVANPTNCSGNIIVNGNADNGTTTGWTGWGNPIDVENNSLRVYNKTSTFNSMYQRLPLGCLAEGQTWKVSALVKMYNQSTRAQLDCSPSFTANGHDCPFVRMDIRTGVNGYAYKDYLYREMIWNKTGWSSFETDILITPQFVTNVSMILLHMIGGPPGAAVLWDNIVAKPTNAVDQLRVSPAAAACWKAGSDLVITSHTRWNTDEQVVKVASSNGTTGIITLTKPIIKPITLMNSTDYAVEVASLTRPIIFEADSSPTDYLIGGHLIVINTPRVIQRIEGVAFQNFGQQGSLGRYPIHFHLCEAVPNTTIKRNVVRNSKQRCIVIHGSNQITIEENVAYNISGHCYVLEDGSEQNNTFKHNIGIKVTKATRLSSTGIAGRSETDNTPAVFWMSNPSNTFSSNIAAGSDGFGFWFETFQSIRPASAYQSPGLNPAFQTVGLFQDNEVHSTDSVGFSTYAPGWTPTLEARIINLKVYRNSGIGVFLHVTRNLRFINGIVADNGYAGVFINRGDNITFEGTSIIGLTKGAERSNRCPSLNIRGLIIHPTKMQEFDNSGTIKGLTLTNVSLTRWTPTYTGCNASTAAISIGNTQSFTPLWNAPTSFKKVKIEGAVEACLVNSITINDAVIEVIDTSLNVMPGFLVQPGMTAFAGKCIPYGQCMLYCTGSCLRTVRFLTNAASDVVRMVVTGADGRNGSYRGRLRGDDTGYGDPGLTTRDKQFAVSLPAGTYKIQFLTVENKEVYPQYVIPVFEKAPSCTGYVEPRHISIVKPTDRCGDDLIKNGQFEDGTAFWQSVNGNHYVEDGVLITTTRVDPVQHMVTQWLDPTCLEIGARYELSLDYRLIDASGMNAGACDGILLCPKVLLLSSKFNATTGNLLDSWADIGFMYGQYKMGTSFQTIKGTWVVTAAQAASDKLRVNLHNGIGQFMISNATLVKVERCQSQAIQNGNAEFANTKGWFGWGNPVTVISPGADGTGFALRAYNRDQSVRGLTQDLDTFCISAGDVYNIDIMVKLVNTTDPLAGVYCNPTNLSWASCPFLRLHSSIGGVHTYLVVQDTTMVWDPLGWNHFRANVTIPADMGVPNMTQFNTILCGGPAFTDLLVDDFSFQKVASVNATID